eukprot:6032-Eustigmatos_ZCMA.PRE.1
MTPVEHPVPTSSHDPHKHRQPHPFPSLLHPLPSIGLPAHTTPGPARHAPHHRPSTHGRHIGPERQWAQHR